MCIYTKKNRWIVTNFILGLPLLKRKRVKLPVWIRLSGSIHTTETPRSPPPFRTCRKPFFERALTTVCIFLQDIYRKNPTDIRWRSRHRTSQRHSRTVSVSARAPPVWGCPVQDQTSESPVYTSSLVTCLKNFLRFFSKFFVRIYFTYCLRVSTKQLFHSI